MAFYNNVIAGAAGAGAGGATDYQISKSLRFNASDSSNLSKTFSGTSSTTFTLSYWIKRSKLGAWQYMWSQSDGSNICGVAWSSNDRISLYNGGHNYTTAVFRDVSAWYHICLKVSSGSATLYVNNAQVATASNFFLGASTAQIGMFVGGGSYADNSYIADFHAVDGQALDPTDFAEYDSNNVWQPKKYSFGTSPNNGTTWSSGTVTGTLYSGSSWANAFDGSLPSSLSTSNSAMSYSSTGDITLTFPTPLSGTIRVYASGAAGSSTGTDSKIVLSDSSEITCNVLSSAPQFFSFGSKTNITSITLKQAQYGVRLGGIELNGYVLIDGADDNSFKLNFSDNSSNQALGYDSSIDSPSRNNRGGFDAITYTGTSSPQTIQGLAFQADLIWIKSRSHTGWHILQDSVRGFGKTLFANDANAEVGNANDLISNVSATGFSVNTNYGSSTDTATTTTSGSNNYVAWAWKAGGTAGTNTDGSITSLVSASNEYGFSVVKWTGQGSGSATIGHGLSSAPKFILVKALTGSVGWTVGHDSIGWTKRLKLNGTDAASTSSNYWNDTAPTSSVFTSGANNVNNTFVAYCWSEIPGYSKFSTYTGNGSTTGPVVTTGFKPRFVLLKDSSSSNSNNWMIVDSARAGDDKLLQASNDSAENTGTDRVKFTDTGFQILDSSGGFNTNGETYVYAAFGDRAGNDWTTNNLIATAGLETASQGMDVVNWTGNGSTQSISSLAFQPDLVWIKEVDSTGDHHLFDSIRGATKALRSNVNDAEVTDTNELTAFNSNGFSLGSGGDVNASGTSTVAWCWKAGGAASSNSDGSITSSVSANTTYGFSVVKNTYSGSYGLRSVGHGLGKTPSLVISKRTDTAGDWLVHTRVTGSYQMLTLNAQSAATAASSYFSADNSTFSLYHGHYTDNGHEYIHYCWSEIPGFSKISTFTGTGSSGNKVTTGFKPKFVLIKRVGNASDGSTAYGGWGMYQEGETDKQLMAHCSGEEGVRGNCNTGSNLRDIQANVVFNNDGFTVDSGWYEQNDTGVTYIYAAWADKPPGEIIDSLIDTPTDITADSGNNPGNYATLNPLQNGGLTLSNGNLDVAKGAGGWATTTGTIGISSGKYYFEYTASTAYDNHMIGVVTSDVALSTYLGNYASGWGYQSNGNKVHADSFTGSQPTANSGGDIIQVAVDMDAGKIWFGINGTYIGSGNPSSGANPAYSNLSGTVFPAVSHAGTLNGSFNFGARDFSYTPPTNFVSICTTNLPDPTIADGSTAFATKLYTGNGGTQTITGLNFSPDFTWIKNRNSSDPHILTDIVRGAGKFLQAQATTTETDNSDTATAFSAFTSDGFTVGNNANWSTNTNSSPFVSWNWDAGETRHYAGEVSGSFNAGSGADKIFDGLITTQANGAGAASSTFTWTLVSPITVNTSLEVYLIDGKSKFTVNGGTQTSALNNSSWQDLGFTGSLSSLQVQGDTGVNCAPRLAAIRIDGTIITDPSLVSAGSLNSSLYNQSQTWSSGITSGSSPNSSYGVTNVFNGGKTGLNNTCFVNNSSHVQVDFTTLSSASTVTVHYTANGSGVLKVNGTNQTIDGSGSNVYRSVTVNVSGLSSVRWEQADGSNFVGVSGIEVDGKLLVDNGVTLANVPSIASTVRANPSSGCSIVTYTGTGASGSVGHGLNTAPGFIIIKRRDSSVDWVNYHSALGVDKYVQLSLTDAATTSSGYWGTVNNNTFGLPSFSTPNASGGTFVAYCFAPVEGYSAFGGPYSGTGSASTGAFQYCGFKPRLLIIKRTDSSTSGNWIMLDSARSPHNVVNDPLYANDSAAEYADKHDIVDFLSNGFKIRAAGNDGNNSGGSFIWAAWAESPFKTARAR